MGPPAVRFHDVSKRFRMGRMHDSLRDLLSSGIHRLLGRKQDKDESIFWALRDVDFSVGQGESLGIIGPNGAGKSTVLKLLAGILRADAGEVLVQGRLTALIEVGAGFHGDLTGRENIFLNGAILGMSRGEIRRKLERIVDFAGVGRFLDEPVKRYSSGMYARLGFSIAAHVDPDVLLVDEVLSVGDAVFRLRCLERMRELVQDGTTLVFVTHNLDQMQAICPRAIVLEAGRCSFDGLSKEAVGHYLGAMSRAYPHQRADSPADAQRCSGAVELISVRFLNDAGDEVVWIRSREPVRAVLVFRTKRPIPRLVAELNLKVASQENVLSFNSGRDGLTFKAQPGAHTITLSLPNIPLAGGQYFWNVRMWDADTGTNELETPAKFPMVIDDQGKATGKLTLEHTWSIVEAPVDPSSSAKSVEGQRCEDLLLR